MVSADEALSSAQTGRLGDTAGTHHFRVMSLEEFMSARAAETYAEPRTLFHDKITFEMAEEVSKLLPARAMILDVGTGQGPALEWFTNNGYYPTGITTNQDDYAACQAVGYFPLLCDQNGMPEAWVNRFDLVWARHVLEHSVIPFYTLHEFHRVLKPGGILYVEVPAPDTSCDHCANVNHYSVLGWRMWASLIERAGFDIFEAKQMQLVTLQGPDVYFSFQARKA